MSTHYQPIYNSKQANVRKIIIVLMMTTHLVLIKAQEDKEDILSLTNVHHYGALSSVNLIDPYLSVLDYSGVGARYTFTSGRFVDPRNPILAYTTRVSGIAALTVNPRSTASVSYLGANASWGMQYYYRGIENTIVLGGTNIDVDFGYKMNSRNVNNPINIDLATNLNVSFGGRYCIKTKRRVMQINALIEFPVIGTMFVPTTGLSYYEMYSTGNYAESIHFSSLHNKQGLKQYYTIDIPFKHLTWSFGIITHELSYKANSQIYSYSEYSFLTGITYDMIKFSGRKAKVPEFFISPKY